MKRILIDIFLMWGTIIFFLGYQANGNFIFDSSAMAQTAPSNQQQNNLSTGKGQLYVYVEPSSASIKLLNLNEKFSQGMYLNPGQYRLDIAAKDHGTERHTVKIASNQVTSLKLFLPLFLPNDSDESSWNPYEKNSELGKIIVIHGYALVNETDKISDLSQQDAFILAFADALEMLSIYTSLSCNYRSMQLSKLATGGLVYRSIFLDSLILSGEEREEEASLFYDIFYNNKLLLREYQSSNAKQELDTKREIKPDVIPSWHELPFSISGINIVDITFSSDEDVILSEIKGGARVTIEVPIAINQLMEYQTRDWKAPKKLFNDFCKAKNLEEFENQYKVFEELDRLEKIEK